MILLTASNADFQEIGDLNEECLKRYCALHPQHSYVRWLIPKGYAMPPSWFKLEMILYHLELNNPHVMWIDADALLIGDRDIPIREQCDLQICQDVNGINCGVMVWRHSNLVMDFLQRINAMTEYCSHPWWEQKAIMDHLGELTVGYMDKATWNAYAECIPNPDVSKESVIVHFPGMGSGPERLIEMRKLFGRNTITSEPTDKIDSTAPIEAVDASEGSSAITTLPETCDAPQDLPDGKETNLEGQPLS